MMRHCCGNIWLPEMAVRGVLLRRGGMNFLTFSHTKSGIETSEWVDTLGFDTFGNGPELLNRH